MRRTAFVLAIALVVATAPAASAQAVVKSATLGTFVAYGLDAVRLRLVRVESVSHADRRPYVRGLAPRSEASGYLILTLEARNDGRIAENLPLLQVTLETVDGTTIDPAVYGPFLGAATVEAPTSATIAPHRTVTLHLAVADIPNDRRVAELTVSPNDTTPAYRYRLRMRDIIQRTPLATR